MAGVSPAGIRRAALLGLWLLAAGAAGLLPARAVADGRQGMQETETAVSGPAVSDPSADVEDAADWEASLEGVSLSGSYAADLLMVARSQLGYAESGANYIENADGTRNGYSRYGAWAGDPYGNWCALFVAFCLDYAEVPEDVFQRYGSCGDWVAALKGSGLWSDGGPAPGDLVFFDWDGDGTADHVGIVAAVTEEGAVQAVSAEQAGGTGVSASGQINEAEMSAAETGQASGAEAPASGAVQAGGTEASAGETGQTGAALQAASGSAGLGMADEGAMEALLDDTIESLLAGNAENGKEGSVLVTVNGNYSDMVKMAAFYIEDVRILGYGSLPENEDPDLEEGTEQAADSIEAVAASGTERSADPGIGTEPSAESIEAGAVSGTIYSGTGTAAGTGRTADSGTGTTAETERPTESMGTGTAAGTGRTTDSGTGSASGTEPSTDGGTKAAAGTGQAADSGTGSVGRAADGTELPADSEAGTAAETEQPTDSEAGRAAETEQPADSEAGRAAETEQPADSEAGRAAETEQPADSEAGTAAETEQPTDDEAGAAGGTEQTADRAGPGTEPEGTLAINDGGIKAGRLAAAIGTLLVLLAGAAGIRILLMRRARAERLYRELSGRELPGTRGKSGK